MFYWLHESQLFCAKPSSNMVNRAFLNALNEMREEYGNTHREEKEPLECFLIWKKIMDRLYPPMVKQPNQTYYTTREQPSMTSNEESFSQGNPIINSPTQLPENHLISPTIEAEIFQPTMTNFIRQVNFQPEESGNMDHTFEEDVPEHHSRRTRSTSRVSTQSDYLFPSSPLL